MAFLHLEPFVERELRRWAQAKGWRWPPRLLVLVFSVLTLGLFLVASAYRVEIDPTDLFRVVAQFAFAAHGWAVTGVVRVVAMEMEAGTLELLLLTRIRPRDLIMGQFLVGLGGAGLMVTGLIPWLWVGWLNTGMDAPVLGWIFLVWVVAGVALNSVFLALSTFGRTLSAGAMVGVGVGLVLVMGQFGVRPLLARVSHVSVVAEARPMLVALGCVSLVGVGVAGWRLVRALRSSLRVSSGQARWWRGGPRRPGVARRRHLLDGNPIEWLASAGSPWWGWVVVAAGLGVSVWRDGFRGSSAFEAMCWVRGILLILLAFQAYGQLRFDLKEGTWEALLRTPVTVAEYVQGHLTAWWRQQLPLLGTLAGMPAVFALLGEGRNLSWPDVVLLLLTGVLFTVSDAALASIWFLGAAVKFDGGSFLFAAMLSAGILTMVQLLHLVGGLGSLWPWIWLGLASLIFAASRQIVRREIDEQLETAAGGDSGMQSWRLDNGRR